jgi:hypothetical protein
VELNEVSSLGEYGDVSSEVVELELDLVDLDHWSIDEDVDGLVDLFRVDDRVVRQALVDVLGLRIL